MDSLTHGLLGLAIGALRRSDADRGAVLLCCVLAAEIPDLDYLLPASDSVLHALQAHRGLSHSLLAVPLVALAAAAVTKVFFRGARVRTLLVWSAAAALFAHLLADAWTGWGTRLLLPFSSKRVTLDWMMVVDPFFTAPLLLAALVALLRRRLLRTALLAGLACSVSYLALRIAVKSSLTAKAEQLYPAARAVTLFPSWLGPLEWRYVADLEQGYAAGDVRAFGSAEERARHPRAAALSSQSLSNETVQEALAWARFPLLEERPLLDGGTSVRIADLRYHLMGAPTLTFSIALDGEGRVRSAELYRGGSARALFERFRER